MPAHGQPEDPGLERVQERCGGARILDRLQVSNLASSHGRDYLYGQIFLSIDTTHRSTLWVLESTSICARRFRRLPAGREFVIPVRLSSRISGDGHLFHAAKDRPLQSSDASPPHPPGHLVAPARDFGHLRAVGEGGTVGARPWPFGSARRGPEEKRSSPSG